MLLDRRILNRKWWDVRRAAPRVDVEALCSEIVGHEERPGFVIDLSGRGVRIERPYVGGPTPRGVQLEIELPGIDEILWARGEVCFDRVRPGPLGSLLRTTGVRLAAAAARDFRLLRDYVVELKRSREAEQALAEAVRAVAEAPILAPPPRVMPLPGIAAAACFLRG